MTFQLLLDLPFDRRPCHRHQSRSHIDANHPDAGAAQFAHSSRCPAAGSQRGKELHSPGLNKPPTPPPPPAATEVCCFESHSQAPEGLLIPISDNSPQSLIIYSCPPVNNKTKQNKTKENDRNGWKGGAGKSKPLRFRPLPTPAFDLLMTIAIKIITVYTAGRQKFSISRLICFSPALLSFLQRSEGESRGSFH